MSKVKTKQPKPEGVAEFRAKVRGAFARYVDTEGCSCCRNIEGHKEASEVIGRLLHVRKYEDGSDYDFSSYIPAPKKGKRNAS